MSDYEDEMDVDAPKDVQFSSDNASGKKRTAADLPVEALDNLPWYVDVVVVPMEVLTQLGLRNTVPIALMMCLVTRTFWPPSTVLSTPMYDRRNIPL